MFYVNVAQMCSTLRDTMDYTVHGILQARILKWIAISFSSILLDIVAGNVCQDNVLTSSVWEDVILIISQSFLEKYYRKNCTVTS